MYSEMFTSSDQMLHYAPNPHFIDRKWKSNPEIAPNCPRCASPNTKFCYYNNYSLSQPRYFCKGCRRYWTKGGSLRNVPVGGGCRRSRRSKAVRQSENHRVRTSPPSPSHSTNDSKLVQSSGSVGSDIDLAAVFAKFLNQNGSELVVETNGPVDLAGDVEIESRTSDQMIDEAQLGFVGDNYELRDHVVHDDCNFVGFEGLINTEGEENNLQSIDWQRIGEFSSDFGSFSSDDQTRISNEVVGDCWNSFDLSAYL